MIKRFMAAFQLWIGIDHFFEAERIAKYTTFLADPQNDNEIKLKVTTIQFR